MALMTDYVITWRDRSAVQWPTGGVMSIPATTKSVAPGPLYFYDGGPGTVYGTTKIDSSPDIPVSRRVCLFIEKSIRPLREMWSDPVTGAFTFSNLPMGMPFTVIAYDYTQTYPALIWDGVLAS
ncbi:MAG: hypothetical protein JSS14_21865 [Proteobacteria bacterium]|nr:hypothetical protein [Pseudomonadota bacterium]